MSIARSLPASFREADVWRRFALPVLVATGALAVAFIGAILIGQDSGIDGVNGFVEGLSGDSSSFLGKWGLLAPLGFAFAAGMVAAVNPCGFAMLPAYLGLYLGENEQDQSYVRVRRLTLARLPTLWSSAPRPCHTQHSL